jgi:hypothetical protein
MTTKMEGVHRAEFLLSEGPGAYSRDVVTITQGSGKLYPAGTILTASNVKATNYAQAAKIVYGEVDATEADAAATVISRLAEVHGELLGFEEADDADDKLAATTALAAVGIVVRWTDLPISGES